MWKEAEEILTKFLWLYSHLCGEKDVRNAGFSALKNVSKAMGKRARIDYLDILM